MSELVLVFPVIALTVIVLLWLLFVFGKYLRARDALDAAGASGAEPYRTRPRLVTERSAPVANSAAPQKAA